MLSDSIPALDSLRAFMLGEEFRPVVGFEGFYEINSLGDVRRIAPGKGAKVGRILRWRRFGEYWGVTLCRSVSDRSSTTIHRMLAEAFLGLPSEGEEVNHIDGDKRNNDLANLEWVTRSEQSLHAYRIGLKKPAGGRKRR